MNQEEIAAAMERAREHLRTLPPGARYPDTRAVATVERGLRVRVTAYAACVTSLILMRAAELGFVFDGLEVTVDSESDDRGGLGAEPDVPSGPLSMKVTVRYAGSERDERESRAVIDWGVTHCHDAVVRSVPVEVLVARTAAAVPTE